jgi:hypothetical protein
VGTRKPISGDHKKDEAESLSSPLFCQCANSPNRTNLHHRRENREGRDSPARGKLSPSPIWVRCRVVEHRGCVVKLSVVSARRIKSRGRRNRSSACHRRRKPRRPVGSLFLASIPSEYIPKGFVFIRASCRGNQEGISDSNLAVRPSAAMALPWILARHHLGLIGEKERVEESWAPLIRLPAVEIRRQVTIRPARSWAIRSGTIRLGTNDHDRIPSI